jgi:D-alanyl-D-alanine carboxypeptidase
MFRYASLFLLCLCCVLVSCGGGSDDDSTMSFETEIEARIEAAVMENMQRFGGREPVPGVVVGIWAPGRGTYVREFGVSDLQSKAPIRIRDRFRIGSNTKTFVVSTLLQLADEGRVDLDDPVSRFDLGVSIPNADAITLRMLCNMTSGLFEAYNAPELPDMVDSPSTHLDTRELVALAAKYPPLFAPGTDWNYCNTNYLILDLVISSVAGRGTAREIQDRFIRPFGLAATSYPLDDPGMPKPFTRGYALDEDGAWEDATVSFPPTLLGAAGVMIADMTDLKRWVKVYATGAEVSAQSQQERLRGVRMTRDDATFGLGIVMTNGWRGYTGGLPGYHTSAYYLPEQDATMIVLVNSFTGMANVMIHDLTAILFPDNVAFSDGGGV